MVDITNATLGTLFQYDSNYPTKYVLGDVWQPTWGSDDKIYVQGDDCIDVGTPGWNDPTVFSSNLFISSLDGYSTSMSGTTVNPMTIFGTQGETGSDGYNWKASGLISVNGNLYCNVFRMGITAGVNYVQIYSGQLIKSTDHGVSFSPLPPSTANPYSSPMFPANFGALTFIQYGKDYQGNTVHNSNLYVYAVSADSKWGESDNLILGRVLISDIASLDYSKWSFYKGAGANGMLDANWGSRAAATPIVTNAAKIGSTGIQYLPFYQRYVWIDFYYPDRAHDTYTTVWDWYQSPTPWGPWTKFKTISSWYPQGLYSAVIIPNSVIPDGGKTVTVISSGNYGVVNKDNGYYTLWLIPVTFDPVQNLFRHPKSGARVGSRQMVQ